jgi:hypothetical protein
MRRVDTPDRPFELSSMANPPRRRTGLIVGIAAGAALIVAAVATVALMREQHAEPAAQPQNAAASTAMMTAAASPTPTYCPRGRLPSGGCAGGTDVPPSPAPTLSETCSSSATWDQAGGTTLIDAYVNNQGSGNVLVEDIKAGCPQYLPVWQKAQGGIPDGSSFAVPAEVKPGTYETTSADLEGCYWERSRGGDIVDNKFITASKVKQRVTIRSTDDTFVTRKCGNWVKVG